MGAPASKGTNKSHRRDGMVDSYLGSVIDVDFLTGNPPQLPDNLDMPLSSAPDERGVAILQVTWEGKSNVSGWCSN